MARRQQQLLNLGSVMLITSAVTMRSIFVLLLVTSVRGQFDDPCALIELSDCGGNFSSPNYPSNYNGQNLCQWLIQSTQQPNGVVTLYIHDLSTILDLDTLTIYDGDNSTSPVIARLSGNANVLPNSFSSTNQYMFVEFSVTSTGTERGFNASYRSRSYGGACSPLTSPMPVTGGTGTLVTPNYPNEYPSLVNCSWRLTSSAGTYGVMKVLLSYFNTTNGNDVAYFYDGESTDSSLIATLFGSANMPLLLQSTQPSMLVVFQTDNVGINTGFSASYTSATTGGECSSMFRPRIMSSDVGSLTSPNFPNKYYNNANCEWLLTSDLEPFGVITLDFNVFDLGDTGDIVYLYDGRNAYAPLIRNITGSYAQPQTGFTSTTEHMFVRFVSNGATTSQGFSAAYRTTTTNGACSLYYGPARFTAERGQFVSPNYPYNYYDNAECRWLITADGTFHVVTLNFDYFDTELNADFLTIHDGGDVIAPLIARLSGSEVDLRGPYMSTMHQMFLRFTSDETINSIGFSAEYTTTSQVGACAVPYQPRIQGANFTSFASPNYPNNYYANADCQWLIIAQQANYLVTLQFDYFETYNGSDFVNIHNGSTSEHPLITTLSGSYPVPPGPFTSTQRQMVITFRTDGANNARGFSAMARSLEVEYGNPCEPIYQPKSTEDSFGSLSSPRYPDNYTHNADCRWLIKAPYADGLVTLNFDYFLTELNSDFVYVYDGSTTNDPLLARLHGSNCIPPEGLTSSQQFMLVQFTSDATLAYRGFSANYQTATFGDSCSTAFRPRLLSNPFGTITSPSYPAFYYNNADCEWLLTSDLGLYGVVTLDFTYFDTETDSDFVYVYDGSNTTDPLIVQLHGSYSVLPQGFTTLQSNMLVRFTSDGSVTRSGFSANYKSTSSGGACSPASQPLELRFGGTFSAPNNTLNYYNKADCSWLISSSDNQDGLVKIDFDYFNTQLDTDTLYVYDGPDDGAPLITQLSGTYCTPPGGVTTTQPYMFVRFTSDTNTNYNGFGAKYSSIAYGGACSPQTGPRILTGSGGTFFSPNYPNNYFDDADCQWILQTSNRPCEVLELTFQYFYTEPAVDYVSIFDGATVNDTLLARFSGTYAEPPSAVTSTGQYLLVEFISDGLTNYGGFTATYWSILGTPVDYPTIPPITTTTTEPIPDPCSPATQPFELTGSIGTVSSANYPGNYADDSNCQWRITSPNPAGTVTIVFDDFQTDACCDILYVYDGDSDKAPLIGTFVDTFAETRNTTQRYMYLKFITDDMITNTGWRATYYTS